MAYEVEWAESASNVREGEHQRPRRRGFTLAAVSLILNILLTVFGRGSFLHDLLVFAAILYVALPVGILAMVAWMVRRRFSWTARVARAARAISILLLSTIVSVGSGAMMLSRDIAQAKAFCESLIPKVERYKAIHGAYPAEIRSVDDREPPRLLDDHYYQTNGFAYSFWFINPGGMMDTFVFDSQMKRWQAED